MKQGDVAWIIENNRTVRECKIVRISGSLAIIRFVDGSGTRLPLNAYMKLRKTLMKN